MYVRTFGGPGSNYQCRSQHIAKSSANGSGGGRIHVRAGSTKFTLAGAPCNNPLCVLCRDRATGFRCGIIRSSGIFRCATVSRTRHSNCRGCTGPAYSRDGLSANAPIGCDWSARRGDVLSSNHARCEQPGLRHQSRGSNLLLSSCGCASAVFGVRGHWTRLARDENGSCNGLKSGVIAILLFALSHLSNPCTTL